MVEAGLKIEKEKDGGFRIILAGDWKVGNQLPSVQTVADELAANDGSPGVAFDTRELEGWDSVLLTFLLAVIGQCERQKVAVDMKGLPPGVNRLLTLATAVPEQQGARQDTGHLSLLARIGKAAIDFWRSLLEFLDFIGETAASFVRLCTGKAQFRRADLLQIVQECSAESLPIVSLISLLVGLILAFVGARRHAGQRLRHLGPRPQAVFCMLVPAFPVRGSAIRLRPIAGTW